MNASIFKAYDIRGIYPAEIDEDACYKIGQAFAALLKAKKVVVGRDVRVSGPALFDFFTRGLRDHGVDVIDIGVVTTDMMYFAAGTLECDGAATISASHNPREYNGIKLVHRGAVPISEKSGLQDIKKMVLGGYVHKAIKMGEVERVDVRKEYVKKCLSFVDKKKIKPLKVVANAMNGAVMKNVLEAELPVELVMLNAEEDGNFPKGQPDPMQEKNRRETSAKIKEVGADLGAAWDADADRFFLFDEKGRFIPGYYLTAFLGEYFSKKNVGAKIIHDDRLVWATEERVQAAGGVAVDCQAGHSFIKEKMREVDAVFAGEESGHYYYRDFFFADNGFISFLLTLEIISLSEKKVSEIFKEYFEKYPISGEINLPLGEGRDLKVVYEALEKKYAGGKFGFVDGLSILFEDWRASVRGSNTEPLLRVNLEAKSQNVLEEKQKELLGLLAK